VCRCANGPFEGVHEDRRPDSFAVILSMTERGWPRGWRATYAVHPLAWERCALWPESWEALRADGIPVVDAFYSSKGSSTPTDAGKPAHVLLSGAATTSVSSFNSISSLFKSLAQRFPKKRP
jgi:hypothetical protein